MSIISWANTSNYQTHILSKTPSSLECWQKWAVNYCRAGQKENALKQFSVSVTAAPLSLSLSLSGSKVSRFHACSCRLTDAFSLICHSNRPAEETGSSSQVTRAGIDDPIVSTQVLLGRRRLGANPITRHTIRVVGLVYDACGAAGAQYVTARFWRNKDIGRVVWKWHEMQEIQESDGFFLARSAFRNVVTVTFTYSCICPGTVRPDRDDLCI